MDNKVTVKVIVDETEIDIAVARAERLVEVLKEANALINAMASKEVRAALEVQR